MQSTDMVQGQCRDVAVLKEKAGRSRQAHLEVRNKQPQTMGETDRWDKRPHQDLVPAQLPQSWRHRKQKIPLPDKLHRSSCGWGE